MNQDTSGAARQRLDFEDDEAREERLGKLFQDISKSDTPIESIPHPRPQADSRPYAVPESDVLARVRAFLPDFQASTTALMAQASLDPDAVNVENVKKGERAIAMDLGLGVYDAPGAGATAGNGLGPIVDSDASGLKEEEDGSDEDASESDDDRSTDGERGERGASSANETSSSSEDSDSDSSA